MRNLAYCLAYVVLAVLSQKTFSAQNLSSSTTSSNVAGTPFEIHHVRDKFNRNITYYVNHPQVPAPLLLMIQGSGCVPLMNAQPSGTYSTMYDLLPLGKEAHFTVIAVEKPFSGVTSGKNPGTAESCSTDFNSDFTAGRWLAALETSLEDVRRLPWVDKRRTLVLGTSEGAVMAALLAGHDSQVTDVITIGGSGTTQLFDFIVRAYHRCFDVSPCLADIDHTVRAIDGDPSSSTQFAWGHPYKRWSSFLSVDPAEELLHSKARVYLAFGTDDQATPPLSEEVAVAKLMAASRNVTVRRVPNANHMLLQQDNPNFDDLEREYRVALKWFWEPSSRSSIGSGGPPAVENQR